MLMLLRVRKNLLHHLKRFSSTEGFISNDKSQEIQQKLLNSYAQHLGKINFNKCTKINFI